MGAAATAETRVSLRGPKPAEASRRMVAFRLPPELIDHIDQLSKETGREKTEIVVNALELDRDLTSHLEKDVPRLTRFAASHEMTLDADLPDILALLIRAGLDGVEGRSKKK